VEKIERSSRPVKDCAATNHSIIPFHSSLSFLSQMSTLRISKYMFQDMLGEKVWSYGSGERELLEEGEITIREDVNDTFTAWIEEWIEKFNQENTFKLVLKIDEAYGETYYTLAVRIEPTKIKYPKIEKPEKDEYYEIDYDFTGEVSGMAVEN
jgi:hypothetical protein